MSSLLKKEKRILWISFSTGAIFAAMQFAMAIFSGSQSVLMDAAYDSTELIVIGFTLFLTPLFHRPISEKRPFGYAQVESIFIIIKGFMMLAVTIGLSVHNIELALSGGNPINGTQVSIFQLVLGSASLAILFLMMHLAKEVESPTITAEIQGWKLDVYYSLGMAIAFYASNFLISTPFEFITPYFDQLVSVGVILFMLPSMLRLLLRSIRDAFLFSPEEEIMDNIKNKCHAIMGEYTFIPTFFDVVRTGRRLWIGVYFDVQSDTLLIKEMHHAEKRIQESLDEDYDHCEVELILN